MCFPRPGSHCKLSLLCLASRTNITEPLGIWPSSRGALITSFLLGEGSVASAGSLLEQQETAYAGFNMMLFAPTDVPNGSLEYEGRLVTNHTGGGKIRVRELESSECASGGVSNGVDGRGGNTYPKICEGVSALKQALQDAGTDEDKLISCLLELLTCVLSYIEVCSLRSFVLRLPQNTPTHVFFIFAPCTPALFRLGMGLSLGLGHIAHLPRLRTFRPLRIFACY